MSELWFVINGCGVPIDLHAANIDQHIRVVIERTSSMLR